MNAEDEIADSYRCSETTHHLLFVEHPPVYTLGKSGKIENVLISEEERKQKTCIFQDQQGRRHHISWSRQIVAYPILDLEKFYTDIGRYMRDLEEVIIRTIGEYGIQGDRPGETGVWLDPV